MLSYDDIVLHCPSMPSVKSLESHRLQAILKSSDDFLFLAPCQLLVGCMGGSEIVSFVASGGVVLVVLAVIASSSRACVACNA